MVLALGLRLTFVDTGRAFRTSNWRYAMDLRRDQDWDWVGRIQAIG